MSLVGFSAQNHPQQAVRDDVDDRRTPRQFFDPLNERYRFTIDVAASDENALLPKFFTRHSDGLIGSWAGERVWCNPPFSRLAPWLAKAWFEMERECELVVMLLPANRTEQRFWQEYVEPFRDFGGGGTSRAVLRTRFPPGRLQFEDPSRPRPASGKERLASAQLRLRPSGLGARRVSLTTQFVAGRLQMSPAPDRELGPSERKRTGPPFGCVLLTWQSIHHQSHHQ